MSVHRLMDVGITRMCSKYPYENFLIMNKAFSFVQHINSKLDYLQRLLLTCNFSLCTLTDYTALRCHNDSSDTNF
jgi:hypothetical protein